MNIILDTNVLFGDWTLHSADAKAFLDYVENTSSTIYIPRIVWEEIRKNQQEDLAKKHEAYESACRRLGGSMVNQPDFKVIKFEHVITGEDYLDWLRKKLRFDVLENVLPYGDYTERIANRVMAKRKPFNLQNSNEYKDALVWETVLDVIAGKVGKKDEEVVFISNDVNAFGAGKNQNTQTERGTKVERQAGMLHSQLQEDANAALGNQHTQRFYYYETFAEFLSAHYTPIQGINQAAVLRYLSSEESGFIQTVQEVIGNGMLQIRENIIAYNAGVKLFSIENLFTFKRFSAIQDFYVYSSNKGERVTASGRVFIYMSTNATYSYSEQGNNKEIELHPVVEVKLHIPYKNGQPEHIAFDNADISMGTWMRLPNSSLLYNGSALQQALPHLREGGSVMARLIKQIEEVLWEKERVGPVIFDLDLDSLMNTTQEYKRKYPLLNSIKPPVDPAARKGRKKSGK